VRSAYLPYEGGVLLEQTSSGEGKAIDLTLINPADSSSEEEDAGSESEDEVMPKGKRPKVKSESESEEEVMPKSKRPLVKSGSKETAMRTAKKVGMWILWGCSENAVDCMIT